MNNTLYLEDFSVVTEIEMPDFSNDEELEKTERYIREKTEHELRVPELAKNAYDTIMTYCRPGKNYAIVRFKEYFGILLIIDEFEPRTVNDEIHVFDRNYIYPAQRIQKTIDWVY